MRSGSKRRAAVWLLGTLLLLAVAGGAAAMLGLPHHQPRHGGDPSSVATAEGSELAVKTVRPRRDSKLQVAVEQLASVEPYFQADLRTRVAGVVRAVRKDIGDRVKKGEVLVEVDVPDLEQEVAQKANVVEQRRQEVRAAAAARDSAAALLEVARAGVRQRRAEVAQADAAREFRQKRLARLNEMAGRDTVVANVVDEERRDYQAAAAAAEAARAGVEKAEADLKEKESSLKAAQVDIDLRTAVVAVAQSDLARSRSLADYARVAAPFDGVVLRRNVDPGTFVQNATSGQSEALLTVARTDVLSVVAKFPDSAAPAVAARTPATVRLDELPGSAFAGTVTRFSPSISDKDRTMRVEVDLFNGPKAEFEAFLARPGDRKGAADAAPTFDPAAAGRLLPGMTGVMRLQLSDFAGGYVVPSSVLFSRGGKSYVLLVEGGRTRQVPARVQVNDGTLARVSLGTGPGGAPSELTGAEEFVASRQLEVGDGQAVRASPTEW